MESGSYNSLKDTQLSSCTPTPIRRLPHHTQLQAQAGPPQTDAVSGLITHYKHSSTEASSRAAAEGSIIQGWLHIHTCDRGTDREKRGWHSQGSLARHMSSACVFILIHQTAVEIMGTSSHCRFQVSTADPINL